MGAARITGGEKLGEQRYKEEYDRALESKTVEWDDKVSDVEQMWEQVKWTMADIAKVVCGSVRVGRKNQKSL